MLLLKNKLLFCCCDRHQLDQTSTLGGRNLVEISTKLRPPQCRNFDQTLTKLGPNFDQISTKLRPNFDTPSVEVWSKVALYINEIHNKCDKVSTKLRHQTSTKLRPNLDQTSTKLRPNFDQTSTLGVSKFGRNFDQTSTLGGLNLVEISTKLRHPTVQNILFF